MRPAHVEVIYRPHLRYQPSLHAHKDWWDKCNATWFLRAQTSDKICQYKKSRLCLFILDNRKRRMFYLKDNNGKLWVDEIVVPSSIHSTLEFRSMISLHQSLYGQVFKPRCSFH